MVTGDQTCHLKIMSMTLNPLGYAIKDKNLSQLTCLSRCLMHLAILVNSQSTYQSGVRTRVLRISKAGHYSRPKTRRYSYQLPVIMTMVAIRTVFQTLRVRVPSKTPLQVIVTIGATFNFSSLLLGESGEDGNDCGCSVST